MVFTLIFSYFSAYRAQFNHTSHFVVTVDDKFVKQLQKVLIMCNEGEGKGMKGRERKGWVMKGWGNERRRGG